MSAYCEVSEVTDAFPQISDWGTGQAPSLDTIQRVIEENSALVGDTLRLRYQVPFDPAPRLISRIVRDLSIADVRDMLYGVANQQDYQADIRRKTAMQLLRDLASGVLDLGPDYHLPSDPEGQSPGPPSAADTGDPTFTRNRAW